MLVAYIINLLTDEKYSDVSSFINANCAVLAILC